MFVRDVFVAGGMPSVTYVNRSSANLEKKLKTEIREGYKVICVTGPTKSGKTVLTRHVLGREKSALVNGGQVENSSEFWSLLLQDLRLPESETETNSDETSAGFRYILTAQATASAGKSQVFNNKNKNTILTFMREQNLALVVDDFHYLPMEVQREIVRSLKSEVFEGLVAILIAVPHRAFDAIGVEREMEGRFAHVEIPTWEIEELAAIPVQGFPKLQMRVDQGCLEVFSDEANGSPLLMQRFCNRLCNHYDIEETLTEFRNFHPSDDVRSSIFEDVAKQFGFPTFEKLSKGPQSRGKRLERQMSSSDESLDIYQSVLRAVSNTGPKEKLHYNEIRDELRKLLIESAIPQKHEVSAALGHMSGIAKDSIQGEPVLEWSDDFLYLTDPFLMFYMRWVQRV
ncbi:MAG: TniB family NTP-binding protein [Pseudomonadota bacterium]